MLACRNVGNDRHRIGARRKHNRGWNEQLREHWDTLFRELEVTVHVTSFIRKSGLTATRFPVR